MSLAELTPSAINRSTNSHILIFNRVVQIIITKIMISSLLSWQLGPKVCFYNSGRDIEGTEQEEQLQLSSFPQLLEVFIQINICTWLFRKHIWFALALETGGTFAFFISPNSNITWNIKLTDAVESGVYSKLSICFSQVLLPKEEEELVESVIQMGKKGPIIFDRHFFTLERQHL